MNRFLSLMFFFLLATDTYGQVQVFKDFDFDQGGYILLGQKLEQHHKISDQLGDFYTDDIPLLNGFKKEWVFKPGPQYACGFHYYVDVCKGGKSLATFAVNLECNEIECPQGAMYFDNRKLEMFASHLKKAYHKMDDFPSREAGRNYIQTISKDPNLILIDEPEWQKYEGEFYFDYPYDKPGQIPIGAEQGILDKLTQRLKKAYSNEPFDLEVGGSTWSKDNHNILIVEVKCNKTLMGKFKLYPLDKIMDWEDFNDLTLSSYWVKKPN